MGTPGGDIRGRYIMGSRRGQPHKVKEVEEVEVSRGKTAGEVRRGEDVEVSRGRQQEKSAREVSRGSQQEKSARKPKKSKSNSAGEVIGGDRPRVLL